MNCRLCFDELGAELVAERCRVEVVVVEKGRRVVEFRCRHRRRRRHTCYPGTDDWAWVLTLGEVGVARRGKAEDVEGIAS